MKASEFVKSWKDERDDYLVHLFAGSGAAGKQLLRMELGEEQLNRMWQLMDIRTLEIRSFETTSSGERSLTLSMRFKHKVPRWSGG